MWKRCEAAEKSAAEKRQRKYAAKRGKQGAQKAPEPQQPQHDHLLQPRLEVFVERIDGNLPPVIQQLANMLREAKLGLGGGEKTGELIRAYEIGRILQRGLRCRSA